jgi:hypothetical protein
MNNQGWDEKVSSQTMALVGELLNSVQTNDPVRGVWSVPHTKKARVWCDASSLAVGVCIEVNGEIIEDAAWLRKPHDASHINLSELESLIKGVNLAIKWEFSELEVMTDSSTVYNWVKSLLTQAHRIKTHGLGEPLVYRRLTLLNDLMRECGISLSITLVRYEQNKADRLTRVPKRWLSHHEESCATSCVPVSDSCVLNKVRNIHQLHHFVANRTLYTVMKSCPKVNVTMKDVQQVVKTCERCNSIDPAPIRWEQGTLEVNQTWCRVACDVTHYNAKRYLTLVDCAIWRLIKDESGEEITRVFEEIFAERGPPNEILLDKFTSFHSSQLKQACTKWNVKILFRCAYRPSGNGVVERNHRTIKRMAARTGGRISEMVSWYNFTPKEGVEADASPSFQIYKYPWRCPNEECHNEEEERKIGNRFVIGEKVYVKPGGAKCTAEWRIGTVTEEGKASVEVDGIRRDVADIRRTEHNIPIHEGTDSTDASVDQSQPQNEVTSEEKRSRKRPL